MSLKVFDLQCEQSHVFEGWFASAQAYDDQKDRGLLSCPVCGSHNVNRKVSAARLNVSHLRQGSASVTGPHDPGSQQASAAEAEQPMAKIQAEVLRQLRQMVRSTENVGNRFAEETRLMHQGEAPERPIRGVATAQERQELADDGIAVLPIPDFLDDDRMQ